MDHTKGMYAWYYPEENEFSDLGEDIKEGAWTPFGGFNIYISG